jgi:small ligand-binding sensory domain FIST
LSDRPDPTEAVLQAVDDAMTRGGLTEPSAAFLFATHPHAERLGELARSVTEICGVEAVAGASGTGVLTSAGEVEGRPAVAVLLVQSDEIGFWAFGSENLRGRDDLVAAEVAGALRQAGTRCREARRLLVLFPDPLAFNPLQFFPALEQAAGPMPAVGGGATGLSGQASSVFGPRQISNGVAGMFLQGRFLARIATLSSVRLVSRLMRVTRCRGNLVHELDGLPALGVFRGVAAKMFGLDPVRAAQAVFVALRAGQDLVGDELLLVRNVIGLDPARQLLALSQPVEVGAELGFCVLEPHEARRRLAEGLRRLQGSEPSFALYFNCAGRGQSFYGEEGVDTRQIREVLGAVPLAGFFSGAEIAPGGGRNLMHLYTGVLTLVGPA